MAFSMIWPRLSGGAKSPKPLCNILRGFVDATRDQARSALCASTICAHSTHGVSGGRAPRKRARRPPLRSQEVGHLESKLGGRRADLGRWGTSKASSAAAAPVSGGGLPHLFGGGAAENGLAVRGTGFPTSKAQSAARRVRVGGSQRKTAHFLPAKNFARLRLRHLGAERGCPPTPQRR